ncbi:restriction endonuclease subunit S [Fibrella aquatica]|uniref:restriction endonuclease subunit S n=1 Tax=Fibrella aquatica TaxID=3242487 RepID=UPI003522F20E
MIQLPLASIVSAQMGIQKPDAIGGDMVYLQSRDIDELGRLVKTGEETMISSDVEERGIIQPHDILLVAKGARNTAVYYEPDYPKAAASTVFFILRLQRSDVLPAYLAYYLNTPAAQAQLKLRVSSMTTVPVLNKKDFLDLSVPVPDLATQHQLVNLHETYMQVRDLSLAILKKQEALVQYAFPRL